MHALITSWVKSIKRKKGTDISKGAFTIGARLEAIKKSYDTQNSV